MFQHSVAVLFFIFSFQSICAKLFLLISWWLPFLKSLLHCLTFVLSDFSSMLKCSWLWSLLPNGSCITTLSTIFFCEDSNISNILSALVGSNTCWVKKLSCTRHKNVWSSTPVLYNVSHLIFPWLKSPIIIQSPLFTSLIALCILSLFCLVMLVQRYTTPMVTVVCPVTNLYNMASLQSASCNCTSYAGIVSLMYNNTPPPLLPILSFLNITYPSSPN